MSVFVRFPSYDGIIKSAYVGDTFKVRTIYANEIGLIYNWCAERDICPKQVDIEQRTRYDMWETDVGAKVMFTKEEDETLFRLGFSL